MDTVALSRAEFDELPEYSCTLPTGGTIGRRWKRCEPYHASREFGAPDATWYLGEYVDIGDETKVGVTWSLIHVETPRQTQVRKALKAQEIAQAVSQEIRAKLDTVRATNAFRNLGEQAGAASNALQEAVQSARMMLP